MVKTSFETLQQHQDVFLASKKYILNEWFAYDAPKQILLQHNIDQKEFINNYASGVFDYFMGVISLKMTIGSCPVMQKFLEFLQHAEITSDELYEICSHFRRAMIDFSYEADINSRELFNEVSYIFDKNFRSVLRFYSDTIFAKEQEINRVEKLLSQYKKALDESALIFKIDLEGNITYINEKLSELSGYSELELLGLQYDVLKHKDVSKQYFESLFSILKQNHLFRDTFKASKKNGEYFHIDATIIKIKDPNNNVMEYMGIAHDVTKLIDARIEAIKAGEAKDYFLSNMSHEIRTPLNAILGFVNLLMDEQDLSMQQKYYLGIILNSGENLLSIINDILDFSKLRSGEFTIEPKEFLLLDEINSSLQLFMASASSKNIQINSFISPSIPKILFADILRIKQILSNFLSNAIKFTNDGGKIDVNVSCGGDKVLKISVKDNGIGISEDEIQKVFSAFVQAKYSPNKATGGTGLGLSICQQLAEHMGGSVQVESKVGWGSTFWMEIPIEVHNREDQNVDKFILEKIDLNVGMKFQGHVLIAEDNEANQELIKILLSKYGLGFDLATNGVEAVELYKSSSYDLIFMDEQMPKMDGNEAVLEIRDYEHANSLNHTPISALTANVMKGAKERDLSHGYDSFLGKPIALKELEIILKKYLKQDFDNKNGNTEHKDITTKIEGLDARKLGRELMLTEDELLMLLRLYLKKMDNLIPTLTHAMHIRDYKQMALNAHSIKGASGNFRLEDVQKSASTIEKMAKEKNEEFDYESELAVIEKIVGSISLN